MQHYRILGQQAEVWEILLPGSEPADTKERGKGKRGWTGTGRCETVPEQDDR